MKIVDIEESVELNKAQSILQSRIAKIIKIKGPEFIQEELSRYLLSDKLVTMIIEEETKTNLKIKSTYQSYQKEIDTLKQLLTTGLSNE